MIQSRNKLKSYKFFNDDKRKHQGIKYENLRVFVGPYGKKVHLLQEENYYHLNVKDISEKRIKAFKSKDEKEMDFWFNFYDHFDTNDGIASYKGNLIIVPNSDLFLNSKGKWYKKALRLNEVQFCELAKKYETFRVDSFRGKKFLTDMEKNKIYFIWLKLFQDDERFLNDYIKLIKEANRFRYKDGGGLEAWLPFSGPFGIDSLEFPAMWHWRLWNLSTASAENHSGYYPDWDSSNLIGELPNNLEEKVKKHHFFGFDISKKKGNGFKDSLLLEEVLKIMNDISSNKFKRSEVIKEGEVRSRFVRKNQITGEDDNTKTVMYCWDGYKTDIEGYTILLEKGERHSSNERDPKTKEIYEFHNSDLGVRLKVLDWKSKRVVKKFQDKKLREFYEQFDQKIKNYELQKYNMLINTLITLKEEGADFIQIKTEDVSRLLIEACSIDPALYIQGIRQNYLAKKGEMGVLFVYTIRENAENMMHELNPVLFYSTLRIKLLKGDKTVETYDHEFFYRNGEALKSAKELLPKKIQKLLPIHEN